MISADAATAADAHQGRKEYATQQRLNVRLEEARDPNVYEAGAHWTVFCLHLDESDSAISEWVTALFRTLKGVSIFTAWFKNRTVDDYYWLLCACKTLQKDIFSIQFDCYSV